MNKQIKLLCDTNQMAYGSSSALLAILKYLPSINTAFIWGITEEILTSSKLINKTIKINNKDNEQVKQNITLSGYDAVLVISNLTNLDWYLDSGIPVFFVDLHHWYPSPKTHRVWKEARKCFIEKFFTKNKIQTENIISVGPVITINNNLNITTKKQILVNIGGGENRWIKPGENSKYLDIVLKLLYKIKKRFNEYNFIIAAGKKSITSVKNNPLINEFLLKTFNQNDYLKELNYSEILFTSPGLNAVFEGLYYNKEIVFLPPQNASQIIQLKYFENANLVKRGLNLTDYFNDFDSLKNKTLNEKKLTMEVLNALEKLEINDIVQKKMIYHIKKQIDDFSNLTYIENKKNAINILGLPGAKTIAEQILALLWL